MRRPTILVTRPAHQAAELVALLDAAGIGSVTVPTVAIDRSAADDDLDRMLDDLGGAAWLVLTSANGADALLDRLSERRTALPNEVRVAAVGPATAGTLAAGGIRVDHVPKDYLTVAIADGLGVVAGRRIVLARADAATPELRDALLDRGAVVDEVIAYRTVEAPASSRDPLRAALAGELDGISFTSSSTVRGLVELASPETRRRATALPAFCIGPVAAATARGAGFHVASVAAEHTAGGLAAAIISHVARGSR